MARSKHPGQRNSLMRYASVISRNTQRDLHGALLDAEILADVYLAMKVARQALQLSDSGNEMTVMPAPEQIIRLPANRAMLPVIKATAEELAAHEIQLQAMLSERWQSGVARHYLRREARCFDLTTSHP